MISSSGYDLLIILSGIAFTIVGIVAGFWALFWDRSRGRKRCPKCWYNMSGTPSLVCSECGHDALTEKYQLKTRRRWRAVMSCGAIVVVSLGAIRYGFSSASWRDFVPTTVLVYLMPSLEKDTPKLYDQLKKRMDNDSLWDWQWEWLFDRCVDALSQSALVKIYARPVWDKDKPIEYMVKFGWFRSGSSLVDAALVDLDLSLNGESVTRYDSKDIINKALKTRIGGLSQIETFYRSGVFNSHILAANNKELIFDVDVKFQYRKGATRQSIRINMPTPRSRSSRKIVGGNNKVLPYSNLHGPKFNRSYQLHVPVRVVGSSDGSDTTLANSSLLKRIRGHTWLAFTEDGIFFTTVGRAWGEPYGLDLALKFEFLYKSKVVASTNAIIDIDGAGPIIVKLPSIESLDFHALLKGSADDWSVRISGYDKIDIFDLWAPNSWGGEFELPLHIKIEAGKPVPVWSAENEQTFADLDEG